VNAQKEIRFIEMFAGIGAVRLGLSRANSVCGKHRQTTKRNRRTGTSKQSSQATRKSLRSKRNKSNPVKSGISGQIQYRCVWANEWDKHATQIYRKNFGTKELVEGDITQISADSIPDFDLLTAGFPCQAFSIAGKRKGFNDTRGTLFYDIVRVAKAKRPKLLLLENVKGLLSHNKGLTFQIIIESLEELGYLVEWQCLNSKYFGVPQNRERVFIIGHLRGKSGCQIFPVGQDDQKFADDGTETRTPQPNMTAIMGVNQDGKIYLKPRSSALRTPKASQSNLLIQVGNVDTKGHNSLWGRVYDSKGIAPNLNARGGGLGAKTGLVQIEPLRWTRTEKGREARRNSKETHGRDYTPFGNQNRELVVSKEKVSGCVTNAINKDSLLLHSRRIRRLTPVECERLQAFPDGWTKGVADTQRYKCLGNAMTVNVITYLGKLLLKKA